MHNRSESLPCVKGGGFCVAKLGGIVHIYLAIMLILQSPSRLRRQPPLHKGAFRSIVCTCKNHPDKLQFEYPDCTDEENFRRLLLGGTTVYEGTPSDAE